MAAGASFGRGDCRASEAERIRPAAEAMARAALDARLREGFAACPPAAGELDDFRRGLDAAWPIFSAWAREALTDMDAEGAAIAGHGE